MTSIRNDVQNINEKIYNEIQEFKSFLATFRNENKQIFATSSFQSYSLPLIHIISEIDRKVPIYFLDTGYHFPETKVFINELKLRLNINIKMLRSPISKFRQLSEKGDLLYIDNPDYCCFLNKVLPMDQLLSKYDVWITGVRSEQNINRSNMSYLGKSKFDTVRLHPMINWDSKMIWTYIEQNNLPVHPLESKGYLTVGCEPCTSKYLDDDQGARSSRWQGMNKTECGLHTELNQ